MTELREFARHSKELDEMHVHLLPISVDDQQHADEVWEKVAEKKFPIPSDPGAAVIRKYGLLHKRGTQSGKILRYVRRSSSDRIDASDGGASAVRFPIFPAGTTH